MNKLVTSSATVSSHMFLRHEQQVDGIRVTQQDLGML